MTYKVAFDIRTTHMSGIYRYGTSLLKSMGPLLPEMGVKLFALHRPGMQHHLLEEISPFNESIEFVEVTDDYGFIRDSAWLRNWLLREEIPMYYSAHYLVDPDLPVPFIYTIHDLIRIKYPDYSYTDRSFTDKFGIEEFCRMRVALQELVETVPAYTSCSAGRGVFYNYFLAINHRLKERARYIVTVSNTVRQDLMELLSIQAHKIAVVSNAVDSEVFFPRPDGDVAQALQRFGIEGPYCLYVGTGHKHKRLAWFLENIASHIGRLPANGKFVLVGSHYNLNPELQVLIGALRLRSFVMFTGRVSDEELACLYSGAQALVVSSVDEGFCLPVLEALACKTEVIVPDLPIFHEVAGNCAHFYPAHDGEMLVRFVLGGLDDSLFPKATAFNNQFNWNRSALKLLLTLFGQSKISLSPYFEGFKYEKKPQNATQMITPR